MALAEHGIGQQDVVWWIEGERITSTGQVDQMKAAKLRTTSTRACTSSLAPLTASTAALSCRMREGCPFACLYLWVGRPQLLDHAHRVVRKRVLLQGARGAECNQIKVPNQSGVARPDGWALWQQVLAANPCCTASPARAALSRHDGHSRQSRQSSSAPHLEHAVLPRSHNTAQPTTPRLSEPRHQRQASTHQTPAQNKPP